MNNTHPLITRTLLAAALFATAGASQAISVGANVDVGTSVIADTALATTVKARLATDTRLKGADITVNTKNDVLVLTGKAPGIGFGSLIRVGPKAGH